MQEPTKNQLNDLKDMFTHPGYKVLMLLHELDINVISQALEEPSRTNDELRILQGRLIQLRINRGIQHAIELADKQDNEGE